MIPRPRKLSPRCSPGFNGRGPSILKIPKLFCKQVIVLPCSLLPNNRLFIQVDGEKYKIHRYFLTRESEFFRDLFSLPQPESPNAEGSDDNPIQVPETPTVEFENLLRFFYFGYGTRCWDRAND